VAIRGTRLDGHAFIDEAVARGAAAVVAERLPDHNPGVPVVVVPDARKALAGFAAAWYGFPGNRIPLVGITGTFGKTSVLATLETVMRHAGIPIGVIGSEVIGARVLDRFRRSTPLTTPDAISLQSTLAEIADAGARAAAMEVTSQALAQERVHGLAFSLGVFTNVRPLEHRESHGTFRAYVAAKRRFFDHIAPGAPVIYTAGERVIRELIRHRDVTPVGCGLGGSVPVRVAYRVSGLEHTEVRLCVRRALPSVGLRKQLGPLELEFTLPLLGRTHAVNACLAATAALILGAPPGHVAKAMATLPPVKRRTEVIHRGRFTVLDDAASHPESLNALFELICQIPHRRLVIVAAIRGRRGVELNQRYGEALAIWSERMPIDFLVATSSVDAVGETDRVEAAEREAFVSAVSRAGIRNRVYDRLEKAIGAGLARVRDGDLLVLLGAQGMHHGAELLREAMRAGAG